jgi:hypothetical protein
MPRVKEGSGLPIADQSNDSEYSKIFRMTSTVTLDVDVDVVQANAK